MRVGMYVTSFFKTQPQFSGDTEILNWGGAVHAQLVALGCGVLFAANDECARLSRWLHMHVQMTLGLRFVQSSILR